MEMILTLSFDLYPLSFHYIHWYILYTCLLYAFSLSGVCVSITFLEGYMHILNYMYSLLIRYIYIFDLVLNGIYNAIALRH